MVNKKNNREIESTVGLMKELLETNRINLEILEILKLKGRIKLTDRQFIEITELSQKHHREFQSFVLDKLPQFMEGELLPTQNILKKTFLTWSTDLLVSLRYLDGVMKNYMSEINRRDLKNLRSLQEPEVKDKRFWKFLDKVRTKSKVFESFEEPSEPDIIEISENSGNKVQNRQQVDPDPISDKEEEK